MHLRRRTKPWKNPRSSPAPASPRSRCPHQRRPADRRSTGHVGTADLVSTPRSDLRIAIQDGQPTPRLLLHRLRRACHRPTQSPGQHRLTGGRGARLTVQTRGVRRRHQRHAADLACFPVVSRAPECRVTLTRTTHRPVKSHGQITVKRSRGRSPVLSDRPLTCTYVVAGAGFEPATSGL